MAKRTVWVVEGYSEGYLDIGSESWVQGVANCREAAFEIIQECIKDLIKEQPWASVFKEVPTIEEIEELMEYTNDIRYFSEMFDSFLSIYEVPVQYKKRRK